MPIYRTLENIPQAQLHAAFLEGFSDYSVPMNLSEERFQGMLVRNGYVAEISMGAFEDEHLIGFVLNGLRNHEGVLTAYDGGTAVLPAFRRKGVSRALFEKLFELLRDRDIKRYLLEVITTNEGAVQLYRRMGFETLRELIVMSGDRPAETSIEVPTGTWEAQAKIPGNSKMAIAEEPLATLLEEELVKLWEVTPSWQNSLDAIRALSNGCIAVAARQEGHLVGYGLFVPTSGSIRQLAVHPSWRRCGIGSELLTTIALRCSSAELSMSNIDSRATSMVKLLEKYGLSERVRQFEMLKEI